MVKGERVKGKRGAAEAKRSPALVPILLVAVLIMAGALIIQSRPGPVTDGTGGNTTGKSYASLVGPLNSEHTHSAWAFMVDGQDVTQKHFGKFKYQVRSPNVHMEAGDTGLHKHATGVTIGSFFEGLAILFERDAGSGDWRFRWAAEGLDLRANATHWFRLFVNGKEDSSLGYFEPKGPIEPPSAAYAWCLQFGPLNDTPCATYTPRVWQVIG